MCHSLHSASHYQSTRLQQVHSIESTAHVGKYWLTYRDCCCDFVAERYVGRKTSVMAIGGETFLVEIGESENK